MLGKTWPDGDTTGTAASPWTYDAAARLYGIPGLITSTTYNASGQVTAIAYSNGVTTASTYNDARGFVMKIATKTSGALYMATFTYTRDAAGRITNLAASPLMESWTYTYDLLDRLLTSVNASDTSFNRSFSYDAAGNMSSNSGVGSYTYPAQGSTAVRPHAVTAAGSWTFAYDANGNMLSGAGRTLVHDGENRLVSLTKPAGTTSYAPTNQ